jgi:hypothetical protein
MLDFQSLGVKYIYIYASKVGIIEAFDGNLLLQNHDWTCKTLRQENLIFGCKTYNYKNIS